MLIFVPIFVVEFAAAAAAAWKLRHLWSRAVTCLLIPVVSTFAIWRILEAVSPGNEWNRVFIVTAFVPGVVVSVLGGFAGLLGFQPLGEADTGLVSGGETPAATQVLRFL